MNALDDDDPAVTDRERIDAAHAAQEAASVEERAANGEHLEDQGPVPMRGDSQLRLDVGKLLDPQSRKVIEATISLSAAEVPVDGLFRPEQRYPFVAMGVPGNVTDHFVRDAKSSTVPKRVMGVKKRQNVQVDAVRRGDDPEVIRELFGMLDVESKAKLLDVLRDDVSSTLQAA